MVLAAGCVGPTALHQVRVAEPSPATLSAELYVPRGTGPFPALILLHGCSGVGPHTLAWARWLQAEGYAALVLDSFGARGMTKICGDGSVFPGGRRSLDVFEAARYLAELPAIDKARIGAIGWSHGGWTVLRASATVDHYPDVRLRGLVAFYPYCGDTPADRVSVPLLMLIGERDDWTPAEPCRLLADAARRNGRDDVTAVIYPGAFHGFDASGIARPTWIAEARRGQGATIAYDPRAHDAATKQVREFLRRHFAR
jgi:dienelactone hydrolase